MNWEARVKLARARRELAMKERARESAEAKSKAQETADTFQPKGDHSGLTWGERMEKVRREREQALRKQSAGAEDLSEAPPTKLERFEETESEDNFPLRVASTFASEAAQSRGNRAAEDASIAPAQPMQEPVAQQPAPPSQAVEISALASDGQPHTSPAHGDAFEFLPSVTAEQPVAVSEQTQADLAEELREDTEFANGTVATAPSKKTARPSLALPLGLALCAGLGAAILTMPWVQGRIEPIPANVPTGAFTQVATLPPADAEIRAPSVLVSETAALGQVAIPERPALPSLDVGNDLPVAHSLPVPRLLARAYQPQLSEAAFEALGATMVSDVIFRPGMPEQQLPQLLSLTLPDADSAPRSGASTNPVHARIEVEAPQGPDLIASSLVVLASEMFPIGMVTNTVSPTGLFEISAGRAPRSVGQFVPDAPRQAVMRLRVLTRLRDN